jgi:5-(carboxyamino)imidazole ribonucleotide synthase
MTSVSERFDLGFLGGGQLARMSIQAAQRMGLRCVSLDPGEETPASQVAPAVTGRLDDHAAIARLAAACGRLTLENEFVPASALRKGLDEAGFDPSSLVPSLDTLAAVQDKLLQRRAYEAAGVPSPRAVALEGEGEAAEREIGFPMVLKARFGGYDGKGTRYAHTPGELLSYRSEWGTGGWLAESFVEFRRELAVMVYLSPFGDGAFPTMETVQTRHVCDLVFPSGRDATDVAIAAARAMGGFGLFGVELFEAQSGEILVNEIAPRPHNTGHYTLDWGGVSQFEQHVRVAMGLPPAEPNGGAVCMANLLGQEGADDSRLDSARRAALEDPGVRVHWYGKAESRPGRKMGHLNVPGDDPVERAKAARERFYRAWIG